MSTGLHAAINKNTVLAESTHCVRELRTEGMRRGIHVRAGEGTIEC